MSNSPMKIDAQLQLMGFARADTGGKVFNYVRDIGNGLSLVCYAEAGGMPHDNFPVWFGVSFSKDRVEVCGRSYGSGAELAEWLSQSSGVRGNPLKW